MSFEDKREINNGMPKRRDIMQLWKLSNSTVWHDLFMSY